MNTLKKVLVAIAAVATLGATVNSAFAGCYEGYQPSYGSTDYSAYDNSSDYGYDGSYGWDHHGFDRGHGRFEFRGHSRRH
jgi:hypothetical protein